jgi:hypothetical protein
VEKIPNRPQLKSSNPPNFAWIENRPKNFNLKIKIKLA